MLWLVVVRFKVMFFFSLWLLLVISVVFVVMLIVFYLIKFGNYFGELFIKIKGEFVKFKLLEVCWRKCGLFFEEIGKMCYFFEFEVLGNVGYVLVGLF